MQKNTLDFSSIIAYFGSNAWRYTGVPYHIRLSPIFNAKIRT